jgi:hypothetical protein
LRYSHPGLWSVGGSTQGGTVGRLAERRHVLDQPIEEIGRHDTGATMDVRVRTEAYMLDG